MADDLNEARRLALEADKAGWRAEDIILDAQTGYAASHQPTQKPHTGCLIAMGVVGGLIVLGTTIALFILLSGSRSDIERVLARSSTIRTGGRISR